MYRNEKEQKKLSTTDYDDDTRLFTVFGIVVFTLSQYVRSLATIA